MSWWFNKKNCSKNQVKKPTKKTQTKWLGPKQLVQNGTLVKLDMWAKKLYGWFFLLKVPIKKAMISCNEMTLRTLLWVWKKKGNNDLNALMQRKSKINLDYEQVFPLVLLVLDVFSFNFTFLYEVIMFCLHNFVAYKVQDDSFLLSKRILSQFTYKTFIALLFHGHR